MTRKINRRSVLKAAGALGITAPFAGCVGGGDDDGNGNGNGNGNGGNGNGNGGNGGNGDMGGGLADRTIQYGVLMPETGGLKSLGPQIRDGARLPARQVNDEIEEAEFDVKTGDTKTTPQGGTDAANALVDQGVPAFVGPASSDVNLPVSRNVFIPNKVVGISPSSTTPSVTDLDDNDYIYRTAPSDALQGPVMAQIVDQEFDPSGTCSTLFRNDAYGQALEQEFKRAYKNEYGGEVLKSISYQKGKSSYSSELDSAMGADPDFLFVVGFPESGTPLFRDFYSNYDENFPIIVPDGLIDSDLPGDVGQPMNNVWGTAPAAGGPSAETFRSLYKEEWGTDPGIFNSHAYDAAAVIILANARGGENDGETIRNNLRKVANPGGTEVTADNLGEGVRMAANGEEIQYKGASSICNFDENGDMSAVTYDVKRYQDSKITTVRSIDFKA